MFLQRGSPGYQAPGSQTLLASTLSLHLLVLQCYRCSSLTSSSSPYEGPMSAIDYILQSGTSKAPSPDHLGFQGLLDNSDVQLQPARINGIITAPTSAEQLQVVLEELSHLNLTGNVEIESQIATAGGGYCDVFIGYVRRGPNRVKVAVRQLRAFIMLERDFKKVRQSLDLKLNRKFKFPDRCLRKKSKSGRNLIIPTSSLSLGSATTQVTFHSYRSGWKMDEPTITFKQTQTVTSGSW